MEERIKLIKDNLTGDLNKDLEFLNSLYEQEENTIEDATATINAINIILEELNKKQQEEKDEQEVQTNDEVEEEVQRTPEEIEIDEKIKELLGHIDQESDDEAIKSIEELITKIEELTKSDDDILYCSFKNEFEKKLFERIFAGEKKVVATPYDNDTIYIIYANLLLKKKRRNLAMAALDRAIYWNFLNRDAREKKLDLFFAKKEIVKYLDSLKLLQMISYTAIDLADCYNKYGYVFNSLNDVKSAYAMYKLSYEYYQDENVEKIINTYEEMDPSLNNMSDEEILKLAQENEVVIGPNSKIISAERGLITELINQGYIQEAKFMLENDYSMTRDDNIAQIYNSLLELENSTNETQPQAEVEESNEEEQEPPKKKTTRTRKTKKTE